MLQEVFLEVLLEVLLRSMPELLLEVIKPQARVVEGQLRCWLGGSQEASRHGRGEAGEGGDGEAVHLAAVTVAVAGMKQGAPFCYLACTASYGSCDPRTPTWEFPPCFDSALFQAAHG